jgi:hypothetical protein
MAHNSTDQSKPHDMPRLLTQGQLTPVCCVADVSEEVIQNLGYDEWVLYLPVRLTLAISSKIVFCSPNRLRGPAGLSLHLRRRLIHNIR